MAAFDYIALDVAGARKRGVIQADSEKQARQQLREDGLYPVKVDLGGGQDKKHFSIFRSRLSAVELSEFTRQFSVLLEAGIPIDEALMALANQAGHRRVQRCALELRSFVMEGHTLADAMLAQPGIFSHLYCSMVAAGEESGALATILARLANYLDASRAMKGQIKMALAYPMILTVVALGVIFILMSYVVPKIVDQFTHAGQSLPALTEWLIGISAFLQQHWESVLVLVLCVFLFLTALLRRPVIRQSVDRFLLLLPGINQYIRLVAYSRLARTLNILLASGITLLDAFKVAANVVGNSLIREQLQDIHDQVRQGGALSCAFAELNTPSMFMCLIENGERSGTLDSAFERAADMMETTLSERIKFALILFEPLLILVMGSCVLGIVLAILLPILELNNMTLM